MDTDIIRTDAEIRNFLQQKVEDTDIAAEVADEALASGDPECFFSDLLNYGCISGMV